MHIQNHVICSEIFDKGMPVKRRNLPPVGTLAVFESAARLQSFSRAADECALSQASVSRQVRQLEENLSVQLFDRHRYDVTLTDVGRRFHETVERSLTELSSVAHELRGQSRKNSRFTIYSDLSIATHVLTPIIDSLQKRFPEIAFNIHSSYEPIEQTQIPFDLGLQPNSRAEHEFDLKTIVEWLKSPIAYIEQGDFANGMRSLEDQAVNRTALCYHYSHMARGNAREYLFKDQARLKKYFYVLRPLLAIRYLEAFDQPPPIEFQSLVDAVAPVSICPAIEKLLELKAKTNELGLGPPIREINEFINSELERHGHQFSGQGRPDIHSRYETGDALNRLLRTVLKESNQEK